MTNSYTPTLNRAQRQAATEKCIASWVEAGNTIKTYKRGEHSQEYHDKLSYLDQI